MERRQRDGNVDALRRVKLPDSTLELRDNQVKSLALLFFEDELARRVSCDGSRPDVCEEDPPLVLEGVKRRPRAVCALLDVILFVLPHLFFLFFIIEYQLSWLIGPQLCWLGFPFHAGVNRTLRGGGVPEGRTHTPSIFSHQTVN